MSELHTNALKSFTLKSVARFLSFQRSWSSIIHRLAIAILALTSLVQFATAVLAESKYLKLPTCLTLFPSILMWCSSSALPVLATLFS